MYVEVRGDRKEDVEYALRQFSKLVKKYELMDELKRRSFYVKKTKKRQMKQQNSQRRNRRELRRQEKRERSGW